MSKKYLAADYYRLARELLPEMDDGMRQSVEELLKQADSGVKTDNQIVEIISTEKTLRQKLRSVLDMDSNVTLGADFSSLGGDVSAPDAQKFVCPVPGHDYTRRIQKVGEDPGVCPEHNKALIPIQKKRSN